MMGNKLISEFMEMKKETLGYKIPDSITCQWTHCEAEDFRFHSSWDWQIPAYKLVMGKTYELDISNPLVASAFKLCFDKYGYATQFNDVKAGFDAVVEAIQWLNKYRLNEDPKEK